MIIIVKQSSAGKIAPDDPEVVIFSTLKDLLRTCCGKPVNEVSEHMLQSNS